MNEEERALRDGLRQAVAERPGDIRVDVDEVIARASSPDFVPETRWTPPRWLAAAAAVLVVAGLGVGLTVFRPSAGIPAAPAAPSPSASTQFDASDLVGTRWWVIQIDGRSVSGTNEATQPYLSFTSASDLTFFDGCNTGIARYRLGLGLRPEFDVTLGPVGAVACRDDQGRFIDALAAAWSIHKSGELLEFLNPSGTVVLQLARADGAAPQPTELPTNGAVVVDDTPSAPVAPSPTPTATEPPTASSDPSAAVHLRIHNAAEVPISDLKIVFADQRVMQVAKLAPGAYSDFDTTVAGFPVVSMESTLDGRTYHLHKTDATGSQTVDDTSIRPGDHTWTIKLIGGRATIVINEKP